MEEIKTYRPSKEIEAERNKLLAQAEELNERQRTNPPAEGEDVGPDVDKILEQVNGLWDQLQFSRRAEQVAEEKARTAQATRAPVAPHASSIRVQTSKKSDTDLSEAFGHWVKSFNGEYTPDGYEKCRTAGMPFGSTKITFPMDWKG